MDKELKKKLEKKFIETEAVHIKVNERDDLYSRFDPAPVEKKELSEEAEKYLFDRVQLIPIKNKIEIKLLVPKEMLQDKEQITAGIKNHFSNKAQQQFIKNKKTRRKWIFNALWGILFLAICLVLAHVLTQNSEAHPFFKVLGESLGIVGWVAIWEPATYFLYGIRDDVKIFTTYLRLYQAEISIEN